MLHKFNYRKYCQAAIFLLLAYCTPTVILAQDSALKIPAEVKSFVGKGDHAIALKSADLNGDGTQDFILVTEKKMADTMGEDADNERTLMIITRDREGKLKLAKSNKQVVYCKSCGGAFGDPFEGVEAKPNSFTVSNYGGSAWRWSETYQFNYSRIDKTWQLVRAESQSFNALDPNKVKTKIRTPKKFGKIDIADFDVDKIR